MRITPSAPPCAVATAQMVSMADDKSGVVLSVNEGMTSDAVEDAYDKFVDGVLVTRICFLGHAVGNNHAARHGTVAKQRSQTGKGRTLHFEVGDAIAVVFVCHNLLVLTRILQRNTQLTALRAKEATGSDGDATNHAGIIGTDAVKKFCAVVDDVGRTLARTPIHIGLKILFKGQVADGITAGIVVEQAVKADGLLAAYEGAGRGVRLQTATCSHAHQLQASQLGLLRTRREVDIDKRIQLVHDDVNVVAADAMGKTRDAFALVGAGHRVELTAGDVAFHLIEMRGDQADASRIAHKDDLVRQLLWTDMKMENATVFVDNQFGWFEIFHGCLFDRLTTEECLLRIAGLAFKDGQFLCNLFILCLGCTDVIF